MTSETTPAIVIICTAATTEQASRIGQTLLEENLIACVNIIPGVKSLYRWQGKIQQDDEVVMLIKTLKDKQVAVFERIKQLHDYDVPEIIAWELDSIDADYFDWLAKVIKT